MDLANESTVRGNFDNQSLTHFGITSTFFQRDEKYFVNTEGPDGEMADFQIKFVFGYEPLQQYMVELAPAATDSNETDSNDHSAVGQVQVLRLCWDVVGSRWFYLTPPDVKEKLTPDDPLHWTSSSMRWNSNCADCHSTNLRKQFDPLTQTYQTEFSEIDVSCEACHGPGSHHVAIENNRNWLNQPRETGLVVSLKDANAETQIQTCATCHSRRSKLADGFDASCSYDDYFSCELIMDHTYHGDGQIKDEVYVYGSFIQSKMYHQGIRCTDCHDPHSAKVKSLENDLCTSCHAHPAGTYDTPLHHHHQAGSTGSKCVECHMPATTYMEVDPRRDHSLRIPRPDLSVKFDVPNACTSCHLDSSQLPPESQVEINQYLDWLRIADDEAHTSVKQELDRVNLAMLKAVEEWYPNPHYEDQHYYAQLAATADESYHEAEFDFDQLIADLMLDPDAPDMVRASAAMRTAARNSPTTDDAALALMKSPRPRILIGALPAVDSRINRLLEYWQYTPNKSSLERDLRKIADEVSPNLQHQSLEVRIAAARTLISIPSELMVEVSSGTARRDLETVLDEYIEALKVDNDRATAWAAISSIYQSQGKTEMAIDALRKAIAIEPTMTELRSELASIFIRQVSEIQRTAQAQAREGETANLQNLQDQAVKLNLEANKLRDEDHQLLVRDYERASHLPSVHALQYRVAMSHYLRGETEKTRELLTDVVAAQPTNETYLLALATFHKSQQEWEQAELQVGKLIELDPQHPGYQLLRREVEQNLPQEN